MEFMGDEEAFLDYVAEEAARGPHYVVVGRAVPAAFRERLLGLAPVVEDERADGVHLVAGHIGEWDAVTRA